MRDFKEKNEVNRVKSLHHCLLAVQVFVSGRSENLTPKSFLIYICAVCEFKHSEKWCCLSICCFTMGIPLVLKCSLVWPSTKCNCSLFNVRLTRNLLRCCQSERLWLSHITYNQMFSWRSSMTKWKGKFFFLTTTTILFTVIVILLFY